MRLLAVVPNVYDTSPGQRFRLEQWEARLRAYGIEITYAPFEDEELHKLLYQRGKLGLKLRLIARALGRRVAVLRRVREYDAVYLFREAALLGPPWFERWIHRSRVPLIFDFDDAIFVPYISPANGYLSYLKFPSKTRTTCQLATHVMAGNAYLANFARQVQPNVTLIPTTIDTKKYCLAAARPANNLPVIGWSGSFSTVQHLDTLRGTLQRLAQQARFKLRVIGTPRYQLAGVEVEALPWRSETELQDLSGLDIGIMPLPEDHWSKGKCGLKALQYMALGIPTVCSPVGVNSEIIQDGVNGLLAATEGEWIEKLTLLLNSATLRQQLGLAGRATVERHYSTEVVAPLVYQVVQAALAARNGTTAAVQTRSER